MEEKQNKQNNNSGNILLNELYKQEQNIKQEQDIKQEQKNELQESFINNNIPVPPPLPSPVKNSLFIRKNANQIENNTVKNSINNITKDEKNSNIGKVLIPKGLEDKLANIYCINNSTEKNNNNNTQNNNKNIQNNNNNTQNINNQNTNIKTNIRNNDIQNNISYKSQNSTSQNINNLKIEVSDESLQQIVQCVFKNEKNNNTQNNNNNTQNNNNNTQNNNTQNINDITPIENNINRYENRLVKNREELLLLLMGVFIGIFSSNYKFFIP